MNTGRNSKQTTCLCRDTGGKGTLLAQRASFNTLDNWGHKIPTQSKKKKDNASGSDANRIRHVYWVRDHTLVPPPPPPPHVTVLQLSHTKSKAVVPSDIPGCPLSLLFPSPQLSCLPPPSARWPHLWHDPVEIVCQPLYQSCKIST